MSTTKPDPKENSFEGTFQGPAVNEFSFDVMWTADSEFTSSLFVGWYWAGMNSSRKEVRGPFSTSRIAFLDAIEYFTKGRNHE